MPEQPTSLQELLDRMEEAAEEGDQVSIDDMLDLVGRRSFGPVLLLAGLITLAPLVGDIPGVPTIMGVIVFLIAIQLLLRRKHIWFPRWLLKRSVDSDKLKKALRWMRKPSRYIDRVIRPRLEWFAGGKANYSVAVFCLIIAIAMPVMEVIPFSANLAGAALTAFGLALVAHDGVLAIIAYGFTGAMIVVVVMNFPGG